MKEKQEDEQDRVRQCEVSIEERISLRSREKKTQSSANFYFFLSKERQPSFHLRDRQTRKRESKGRRGSDKTSPGEDVVFGATVEVKAHPLSKDIIFPVASRLEGYSCSSLKRPPGSRTSSHFFFSCRKILYRQTLSLILKLLVYFTFWRQEQNCSISPFLFQDSVSLVVGIYSSSIIHSFWLPSSAGCIQHTHHKHHPTSHPIPLQTGS